VVELMKALWVLKNFPMNMKN